MEIRPVWKISNVLIKSGLDELNGGYLYIKPTVYDEFVYEVLSRRFYQIQSLIKTSPRNAMHKLTRLYEVDVEVYAGSEEGEVVLLDKFERIYVWETRRSKMFIAPATNGEVAVLFTTSNNNRYCVVIDMSHLFRGE